MTNEQYFAVAKMWGWKHTSDGIWGKAGHIQFCDHDLEDEINSWRGFWKTIGILHERKLPKRLTDRYTAYYIDFLRGHITSEQFIEATHLAALEGMK